MALQFVRIAALIVKDSKVLMAKSTVLTAITRFSAFAPSFIMQALGVIRGLLL